jgi:hypothetical protein
MTETPPVPQWTPPYIAFTTLTDLLTRLEKSGGIPPQIDRSYLDSFSGGYQSQVIAALKSLDLIGDKGEVSPALIDLIETPEHRKRRIADMLRVRYAEVVKLGEINATQAQLLDAFGKFGITGDTKRKAIAFYMKAAKFADIKVSPHFKVPAAGAGSGAKVSRTRKPKENQAATPAAAKPNHVPEIDKLDPALVAWLQKEPAWPEGTKAGWFATFKAIYKGLHPNAKIE